MEQIVFLRNLMTMLRAGLSLNEALASASEDSSNPTLRFMIVKAEQMVQAGLPLSNALAKAGKIFSPATLAMIETGEQSGKLYDTLDLLVQQKESNYKLRRKVTHALVYPSLIVCTMVLMIAIMMVTIVPQITSVYADLHASLPAFTMMLIWVSNGMRVYGLAVCIILIAAVIGVKQLSRVSDRTRSMLHGLLLRLPLVGIIIKKFNLVLTSRSLYMLLHSAVPIDRATALSARVATNFHYQKAFEDAITFIKRGVRFSDIFKGSPELFPPLYFKMIKTSITGQIIYQRCLSRFCLSPPVLSSAVLHSRSCFRCGI